MLGFHIIIVIIIITIIAIAVIAIISIVVATFIFNNSFPSSLFIIVIEQEE